MKLKLKSVIKKHQGEKIMTINGALQLTDDPKKRTLYSKIKDDSFFKKVKIRRVFIEDLV